MHHWIVVYKRLLKAFNECAKRVNKKFYKRPKLKHFLKVYWSAECNTKKLRLAVYIQRLAEGEHQSFFNFNPRATIHGQRAACAHILKSALRTSHRSTERHLAGLFVARIKLRGDETSFLHATTPEVSPFEDSLCVNYVNKLVNCSLLKTTLPL